MKEYKVTSPDKKWTLEFMDVDDSCCAYLEHVPTKCTASAEAALGEGVVENSRGHEVSVPGAVLNWMCVKLDENLDY